MMFTDQIQADYNTVQVLTEVDRRILSSLTEDDLRVAWERIENVARARLTNALARAFVTCDYDFTLHHEPARVDIDHSDPDSCVYVVGVRLLAHEDLSHMLHRPESAADEVFVQLTTSCGCTSKHIRVEAPVPPDIYRATPTGVRRFTHKGWSVFGTAVYAEAG